MILWKRRRLSPDWALGIRQDTDGRISPRQLRVPLRTQLKQNRFRPRL